uniref:C2H2-type domain-containing protein n=1 Tax=Meloidogyne hapla TaxID=6305 RepID=A0A1I8BRA7_MELHA
MGYRCLLCNKVYGRYNSVSYHVTIYHRNPPIRCEEQGCQFTTREARYIHFHKYYRHQIALPESIDLASRKCPLLGCKHVSKSPAMLEKHMQRHVADCLKEGGSSTIYVCRMPVINGNITKEDENMDSMENNDPEMNRALNMVKSMKERRNTYSGGCSGSSVGQCLYKANSRELMYAHLLNCHSASITTSTTTLSADTDKRGEEDEDDEAQRSLAGGKMSASAPSTPPTSSSQLSSPLLSRFPCNECNFRGRTLTSLTNHKLQKHCNGTQKQQINGTKPPHLPPTKCSSFILSFTPSLFNCGTGGIFGGNGGFSLPGSPISPQTGSLGLGSNIYPTGLPPSFFNASITPTSSTTNLGGLGLINDQQQQNNAHHLLAQLLAAQKLASAILSAAASSSPSSSPATSSSSSPPVSSSQQQ